MRAPDVAPAGTLPAHGKAIFADNDGRRKVEEIRQAK
jgi:hypothetical protein